MKKVIEMLRHARIIFMSIIVCLLIHSNSGLTENLFDGLFKGLTGNTKQTKFCPVDGKVFSSDVQYCPEHGAALKVKGEQNAEPVQPYSESTTVSSKTQSEPINPSQAERRFCPKCTTVYTDSISYCPKDGTKLESTQDITLKAPESEENSSKPQFNIENIELKKAAYGLPLGESLDNILKWCEERNVQVIEDFNPSKAAIEESVRKMASQLKHIKKEIDFQKAQLSELEKEMLDYSYGGNISDAIEAAFMAGINAQLAVLHNPSFIYKDKEHFLYAEFSKGIRFESGTDKICSDERITKNVYSLSIVPTENSQNLKRDSVKKIKILFYKGSIQQFKSYAAIILYPRDLLKQIIQNISEKYGKSKFRYPGEIFDLIGEDSLRALIWGKNIMVIGDLEKRGDGEIILKENSFSLLYYEPNIAEEIIEQHLSALQKCKDDYYQEQERIKKERKEDF